MHLLKIEWLKLKRYKTFYVLSGLFLLVYFLINYAVSQGAFSFEVKMGPEAKKSVSVISDNYSFPTVWSNMAYYFGWVIIFICVLVIVNITNEYRYKTQRQNIIDGHSRLDFLHSKVLLILSINVALTFLYLIMASIFGFTNGGGTFTKGIENVLYVFVYGMNYISFAALLALLIKRSGLAIMILLAFVFFEGIIVGVLNHFTKWEVGKFFPLESSDRLFPLPLSDLAKMVKVGAADNQMMIMVLMSCVYILLYYFIARWRILSTDL